MTSLRHKSGTGSESSRCLYRILCLTVTSNPAIQTARTRQDEEKADRHLRKTRSQSRFFATYLSSYSAVFSSLFSHGNS